MAAPFDYMPGPSTTNTNNAHNPPPPPPPPPYEDVQAPPKVNRPPPIAIAVFGKTGTGKTSFIKAVTGEDLKIGHGLESCTEDVLAVPCKIGDQDVVLVDTPGFDDTNVGDTEILTRIADWMKDTYDEGSLLSGIIYLHRISDPRMDGASMKNLRMFRKLCGPNNLRNVVLATTMWEKVTEAEGMTRESQLKKEFWNDMIARGSTVAKVSSDPLDAIKLVERFLGKKTMVLRLQEELSSGKTLIQTEAGAAIQEDIERLSLQYARDLEAAKEEMREAQKTRDREYERQLRKEMDRVNRKMDAMRLQETMLRATKKQRRPNNRRSWWQQRWRCLGCSHRTDAMGKWTCELCELKQRNVRY